MSWILDLSDWDSWDNPHWKEKERGETSKGHQECPSMRFFLTWLSSLNAPPVQDNWQPALQKLIDSIGSKFSAAFDRTSLWYPWSFSILLSLIGIGCAGEIRINENEDFEKWAIDILVKFRDSEKLQLLTAHRQSGGVGTFSIQNPLAFPPWFSTWS